MAKTTSAVRAKVPTKPNRISLKRADDSAEQIKSDWEWDEVSQTILLRFAGSPKGILVEIDWQ
jgi:hypothetical protein